MLIDYLVCIFIGFLFTFVAYSKRVRNLKFKVDSANNTVEYWKKRFDNCLDDIHSQAMDAYKAESRALCQVDARDREIQRLKVDIETIEASNTELRNKLHINPRTRNKGRFAKENTNGKLTKATVQKDTAEVL